MTYVKTPEKHHCPNCNEHRGRTINSRPGVSGVIRRRRYLCVGCEHRWSTAEVLAGDDAIPDKNDSGPAFPCEAEWYNGNEVWPASRGMSLRDWFAGQALTAFNAEDGDRYITQRAYEIADAMLAARETE